MGRPDSLLLATLLQNAPPVLVQWTFVLDQNGRASPMLDPSALPPGVLAGVEVFAQALVLAPAAPNGIDTLTRAVPINFL